MANPMTQERYDNLEAVLDDWVLDTRLPISISKIDVFTAHLKDAAIELFEPDDPAALIKEEGS
jgi:hypothetical protein